MNSVGRISNAEITATNNAVVEMNGDVNASVNDAFNNCVHVDLLGMCDDERFNNLRTYQAGWTDFSARWNEFFIENQGTLGIGVDEEYISLTNEYNQKRAQFLSLGEHTDAPTIGFNPNPTETFLEGVGTFTEVALVLGAVGIGAYLVVNSGMLKK